MHCVYYEFPLISQTSSFLVMQSVTVDDQPEDSEPAAEFKPAEQSNLPDTTSTGKNLSEIDGNQPLPIPAVFSL